MVSAVAVSLRTGVDQGVHQRFASYARGRRKDGNSSTEAVTLEPFHTPKSPKIRMLERRVSMCSGSGWRRLTCCVLVREYIDRSSHEKLQSTSQASSSSCDRTATCRFG